MGELLERLYDANPQSKAPTWRVRCCFCGRIYIKTSWPHVVKLQARCNRCKGRRASKHLGGRA